jgi:hypothetical protein
MAMEFRSGMWEALMPLSSPELPSSFWEDASDWKEIVAERGSYLTGLNN